MTTQAKSVVLLVDDDHDFLDQMTMWFEREGFEVVTADGEAEARIVLSQRRPDLAMIDLMMERPDAGFTLAHAIKSLDPQIPVLMVTGVAAETGLDFEATGPEGRSWIKADAVLDKPVRFEQISREIDRLGVRRV